MNLNLLGCSSKLSFFLSEMFYKNKISEFTPNWEKVLGEMLKKNLVTKKRLNTAVKCILCENKT